MLAARCSSAVLLMAASTLSPVLAADASERLHRAIENTWQRGPDLARAEASIEFARREAAARSGSLRPYVEIQREGLTGGFDNAPNAAGYLRFGTPFATLGQRRAGRDVDGASESWSQDALSAARWESAGATARLWLDLALVEERIAVLGAQTDRLGRAVTLERKRLGLGEVAGADVVQLELEEARLVAQLAAEEGARGRLLAELARWSSDVTSAPRLGDLAELYAAAQAELPGEGVLESVVESAPAIVAARRALAMQRSLADLSSRTAFGRPSAELEWERIPEVNGFPGFNAWGFLFNVPLPFGRPGSESRRAALARVREVESAYEIERREALARARAHLVAATNAEATLARLEPVFAKLGSTEYALGERFRLGAVNYLVFIDSLWRLDQVRLQHAETLHALLSARLGLALLGARDGLFPLPARLEGGGAEVK
jgi:outer membrane protein TolC